MRMPQGWDSVPSRRPTKDLAADGRAGQESLVLDAAGIAEQPGKQESAFVLGVNGGAEKDDQKKHRQCASTEREISLGECSFFFLWKERAGSEMNTHIEKDRQAADVNLIDTFYESGFRSIVGKFQAEGETAEYIFDSREAVNSI